MSSLRTPHPGGLHEITTRTPDGQKLLRPSREVNEQIIGCLCHAQKATGVYVHAFVFLSTHYHLLISVTDVAQKSKFMCLVNGMITKKLKPINKREGTTWARRFSDVPVSADEATQTWRLRYLLAHGVKENLVKRVEDWPGATSTPWLLHGKRIFGVWTDLSARNWASRRNGFVETPGEFDTILELELTVLPCWVDLAPKVWRQLVRKMVDEIEFEAANLRRTLGIGVLGANAVLAASPFSRVRRLRKRHKPPVHAPNKAVREKYVQARRAIVSAYVSASARFRDGDWDVEFPAGMFRPAGGFVGGCDNATLTFW